MSTSKRRLEDFSAVAEKITPELIVKAKVIKKECAAKKHELMEQIESNLPDVDGKHIELRAQLLTQYLNEHGQEIIIEAEKYTLEELQAEVELYGKAPEKKKGFHQLLLECINESDITERELEMHTAEGIGNVLVEGAEFFNNTFIPGYNAWANGGDIYEIISSACGDILLTLCGGKLLKVAWYGSKALYKGFTSAGKKFNHVQYIERKVSWRQSEIDFGRILGPKAKEQVSYLDGKIVKRGTSGSVRPDYVIGNEAFEIKNYDINKNSSALVKTISEQAIKREKHLPKGMKQQIIIDVRGQEVTQQTLDSISQKIQKKTEGIIGESQIKFWEGNGK